jgi:hypothetical protein
MGLTRRGLIWIGTHLAAFGVDQVLLLACILFRENDGRRSIRARLHDSLRLGTRGTNVLCMGVAF